MWLHSYPGLEVALLPCGDNVYYVMFRGGAALAIDPPLAGPALRLLRERGAALRMLLLTHGDPDHTGGVHELAAACRPVVHAPGGLALGTPFEAVRGGGEIPWEGLSIRVIDTPGHRRVHVAYYLPEPAPGLLFPGDSLFAGGCGRLNGLPPEQMFNSLRSLAELPPETHVYCGHDYLEANLEFARTVEPDNAAIARRLDDARARHREGAAVLPSTLALELETNPFLRAPDVASFAARRRAKDDF